MSSNTNEETTTTTTTTVDERIRDPHAHDVLKGRGGGVNKHDGNVQFRKWVSERRELYALTNAKAEKVRVAQEVIDLVKGLDPPGRFLKMDSSLTFWVELDEDAIMTKVSQALREGAPEVRRKEQHLSQSPKQQKQPSSNNMSPPNLGGHKRPEHEHYHDQQQQGNLLCPSMKRAKNPASTLKRPKPPPPTKPRPQAMSSASAQKRMHPGSGMSESAISDQQDNVRLEDPEAHEQLQRSSKRSKPLPTTTARAAAALVPRSPVRLESDETSRDSNEQQEQQHGWEDRKCSPGKRVSMSHLGSSSNNAAMAPPTGFLIHRLDQVEQRQADLESQLMEEKKQRLKQEQRQGALELQLLEAKMDRTKRDETVKNLRREVAELRHHHHAHSGAAQDDDGENSYASSSGTYLV